MNEFEQEEIGIIAASVDSQEKAVETVEKLNISFPVAYGLDAGEISKATGAFYESEKQFLHATNYLVRPDRTVAVACYSTGPIGRFTAQHVLNLVKFYKSRQK